MTTPTGPAADGAAILAQLHTTLTRYVILPSAEAAVAVALWIAATHAQDAWACAPRLVIRAPEKRCGKSRLLDIVEATCHNPLITVNGSPAAVYRSIGTDVPPTILLDEADTIFGGKNAEGSEDLRGLLNAGHQRNRPAIRYDAATRTVERIPTFAMAALAGIGAMPDTIEDRAVVIRMRRRTPGEKVAPFRYRRDRPALAALAAGLARWLGAHLATLEKAEPVMPLEDRAADTWEPLIAVADLAAGEWPELARHAAVMLTAERDQAADVSDRIRLLADCRTVFGTLTPCPAPPSSPGSVRTPKRPGANRRPASPPSGWPRCWPSTTSAPHRSGSGSPPGKPAATTGPISPTHGPGTAPHRRGTCHNRHNRPRPGQARRGSKPVTHRSVTPKHPSPGRAGKTSL